MSKLKILLILLALLGPGVGSLGRSGGVGEPAHAATADALVRRVRSELGVFTDWLLRNGVEGYIGEVGWPDDVHGDSWRWNALAEQWYGDADAAGLWVTAWSTGEWWGKAYPLAVYEDRWTGTGVDSLNPQASVIEKHDSLPGVLRGVNVAGGEFAAPTSQSSSPFSNANPGTLGVEYHYDGPATFSFLARRGVELVRIPFRWERLQPELGKALAGDELDRLRAVVGRAGAAGLKVVLDMHNYGAYYLADGTSGVRRPIGSPELPVWRFAEIWGRIASNFKNEPAVVGYGLMNEPVGLPSVKGLTSSQVWERASQEAVTRIRGAGDRKVVLVAGYNWSGVQNWSASHPSDWITDPAGNVRYEAHHYWDRDNSGDYPDSYTAEVGDAAGRGY